MDTTQRTRLAFIWNHLMIVPFWGIFSMIPFFLHNDLHAYPWQVATAIALKRSSLLSLWSLKIHQSPKGLQQLAFSKTNAITSPFFFYPHTSPTYLLFAFGFYKAFTRAMVPTWMETLKRNLPEESWSKTCALGSMIDFAGMIALPFLFGPPPRQHVPLFDRTLLLLPRPFSAPTPRFRFALHDPIKNVFVITKTPH